MRRSRPLGSRAVLIGERLGGRGHYSGGDAGRCLGEAAPVFAAALGQWESGQGAHGWRGLYVRGATAGARGRYADTGGMSGIGRWDVQSGGSAEYRAVEGRV